MSKRVQDSHGGFAPPLPGNTSWGVLCQAVGPMRDAIGPDNGRFYFHITTDVADLCTTDHEIILFYRVPLSEALGTINGLYDQTYNVEPVDLDGAWPFLTLVAGPGVSISPPDGKTLRFTGETWRTCWLEKVATNEYSAFGNLEAA